MPASSPSRRFAGKGALVTGAAQGIGRAVAERLADEGARVVVADIDEKHCLEVVAAIGDRGGEALPFVADLQTSSGARALVAHAASHLGRIDVAVHNVGGTIWGKPFWEYDDEQIEREITRSLWPTLWCCRAVVPHMLQQRAGAIVNIGSLAVRSRFRVPYAAAKGGVHAMTVAMSQELSRHGVRVNCVAPGGIDFTRAIPRNGAALSADEQVWRGEMRSDTLAMTPMQRYGRVDEVASAVCYLASDEASYVTGEVLHVAGGAHA